MTKTLNKDDLYTDTRLADPKRCQYTGNEIGDGPTAHRCENEPTIWVKRDGVGSAGVNQMKTEHDHHTLCFCNDHEPDLTAKGIIESGEIER